MSIFVTGAAGFIGFHLAKKLLDEGYEVKGLDSLNNYYDINLKEARLNYLKQHKNFSFTKGNLEDSELLSKVIDNNIDTIYHLAAQAGVRYSLSNPTSYVDSNLLGFVNLMETIKQTESVKHTIFASSSSVYGLTKNEVFKETDEVNHPVSLYAASKRANELFAHSYSNMYGMPLTGVRFFTVYGPWGRPDMALFKFTKAIIENKPLDLFNNGSMSRDFTYVDDVVEGLFLLKNKIPSKSSEEKLTCDVGYAPYSLLNIGCSSPIDLLSFIKIIEEKIGKKAILNPKPMQKGDVERTFADTDKLNELTGFKPKTTVEEGVSRFVDWYLEYYKK